jgi:putative addiction module component (TIGR02574 family)
VAPAEVADLTARAAEWFSKHCEFGTGSSEAYLLIRTTSQKYWPGHTIKQDKELNMETNPEALRDAALELSKAERAKLARDLIVSLDGAADDDASEAWDIELCRRINEVEADRAQLLDVEDVLARIWARIGDS